MFMGVAAAVMAVITWIEAYEATGETPFRFYVSPWFVFLLIVIWINLLLNMIRPWWWKRRQLPLSLSHMGFLLILTGGYITWAFGLHGNISISEGETKNMFRLSSPVLHVSGNGFQGRYVIKGESQLQSMSWLSRFNPFVTGNEVSLKDGKNLAVLDYLVSSKVTSEVMRGPEGSGPTALVLEFTAKGLESQQIVLQDKEEIKINHPSLSRVIYHHRPDDAPAEEDIFSLFNERIEIHPPGAPMLAIPLIIPDDVGRTFTVHDYTVKVLEYHPDFKMGQTPKPDDPPRNPALRLDVSGPGGRATLYTFALLEFHGNQLPDGTEVTYHRSTEGRTVLIVSRDSERIEVFRSAQEGPMPFSTDKPLFFEGSSTQAELTIALTAFWPSSMSEKKVVRDPTGRGLPAYYVRIGDDGEPSWLTPEQGEALSRDGLVHAGLKYTYDLGFELTLDDAVAEFWPRSSIPKAYYSFVRIRDTNSDASPAPARIETNDPLLKNSFRLYMSGMDQEPPYRYSVFAVSKDPGVPMVSVGFLLLIFGLLWLYWVRFIKKPLQTKGGV